MCSRSPPADAATAAYWRAHARTQPGFGAEAREEALRAAGHAPQIRPIPGPGRAETRAGAAGPAAPCAAVRIPAPVHGPPHSSAPTPSCEGANGGEGGTLPVEPAGAKPAALGAVAAVQDPRIPGLGPGTGRPAR